MIHFTLAMIDLAGLVLGTLLWGALAPFAIVIGVAGGFFLVRLVRRRR